MQQCLTETELRILNIKQHIYYQHNTQQVLISEGTNKKKTDNDTNSSRWLPYFYTVLGVQPVQFLLQLVQPCSQSLPPKHTHAYTRACASNSECCSCTAMQYRYSITHFQIIHIHIAVLIVNHFKNNIHLKREIWNNDLFNTHYPAQNLNFFYSGQQMPKNSELICPSRTANTIRGNDASSP
jgi:hypothetical protein